MRTLSRRRFIGISAAAAGLALLPLGGATRDSPQALSWRGRALGAPAELILHHPDQAQARRIVTYAAAEIARLERIFSLYLPDSSLSQLNHFGALAAPPCELVDLLKKCRAVWSRTDGKFDPTIQPLWTLYARHFSRPDADPAGPPRPLLDAARNLVGFDRIACDRNRIAFARRGMALTLNGIAQGYITDCIADLLRDAGLTRTLVDIGEIRAIGARGDGSPWRVGMAGTAHIRDLVDRAVATSSAAGFHFAGPGSPGHLIDPQSGLAASRYDSVSVIAPDATTADALSTAFSLLPSERIAATRASFPSAEVELMTGSHRLQFG